jgi:hypothetical protein
MVCFGGPKYGLGIPPRGTGVRRKYEYAGVGVRKTYLALQCADEHAVEDLAGLV